MKNSVKITLAIIIIGGFLLILGFFVFTDFGRNLSSKEESPKESVQENDVALSSFDITHFFPKTWTIESEYVHPEEGSKNFRIQSSDIIPSKDIPDQLVISHLSASAWLQGPSPDEGYVIAHEDRPFAINLLKSVYEKGFMDMRDKKIFYDHAGEFLGYAIKDRVLLTYVASKDTSWRGFSFFNLQGQDVGAYPVYIVVLYSKEKDQVVYATYAPSAENHKEIKEINNVFYGGKNYDQNLTIEQIEKEDKKAKYNFVQLMEYTPREKLSFGLVLNQIDEFYSHLSAE